MNKKDYTNFIKIMSEIYSEALIIQWTNGLKVKGYIFDIGENPSNEAERLGLHYIAIFEVRVIIPGNDDSITIYHNEDFDCININMTTIPEKITLEDGTIVWENKSIT